ncbi:MAG: peptidylprolyl isomerase, partial [Planctomycetota bacterium]
DPARKAQAGFLAGYNYRRYGQGFADTVRSMEVGEVSAPVESTIGLHLVQLVDRKTTKLEDVEAALREELGRGRARPSEARALRRALLAKYRFRSNPGRR